MDSLKTLMDKKEYALVIKLTANSKEPLPLFYRISSFVALAHPEQALEVINKNQKILETNLPLLAKIHIEVLCMLGKFDEAMTKVGYYKELPYFSQVAEETIANLPKIVNDEIKKASTVNKPLDDEKIIEKLKSKDVNQVIMALDTVKNRELKAFLPAIKEIMVSHPIQSIRSLALLVLVQKQYDKEIKFKHFEEEMTLVPAKCIPPFAGDKFNSFIKKMVTDFANPTLSDVALNIYSSYLIYIYPSVIEKSDDVIEQALLQLASEYLKTPVDPKIAGKISDKLIKLKDVQSLKADINKGLDEF